MLLPSALSSLHTSARKFHTRLRGGFTWRAVICLQRCCRNEVIEAHFVAGVDALPIERSITQGRLPRVSKMACLTRSCRVQKRFVYPGLFNHKFPGAPAPGAKIENVN
eukprot:2050228-Pyramimonas_sp.AAC.4